MSEPRKQALEIKAELAAQWVEQGASLVDIRSEGLRAAGFPEPSIHLPPEQLGQTFATDRTESARKVLVLCARGVTSLETVQLLHQAGHTQFISVAGGFEAWKAADLACHWPNGFDAESAERYARHLAMPQVGADGQQRLGAARVLLVGLGGLNSPAALYLAAAGVGTLGLLDYDRVERSNLQRQILHSDERVGQSKVASAASALSSLNPKLRLEQLHHRLDDENALGLVAGWDVVIDGTDNFDARYALNRACLAENIPLVYGAVMRFQGQVSVFWPGEPGAEQAPCLRCFIPRAPAPGDAPSCAEAGVLGVMPGIVGTLQAAEALKLLLGIGQCLSGRLLMIDGLGMEFRDATIARLSNCPDCCTR